MEELIQLEEAEQLVGLTVSGVFEYEGRYAVHFEGGKFVIFQGDTWGDGHEAQIRDEPISTSPYNWGQARGLGLVDEEEAERLRNRYNNARDKKQIAERRRKYLELKKEFENDKDI